MARPREFDEDLAIDAAMRLFWQKGYEGTSMDDIMTATGLRKSSLYRAFESKEKLYRLSNDRYKLLYLQFQEAALSEPTPRKIALSMLRGEAELQTWPQTPRGCFETNGALACSDDGRIVQEELIKSRTRLQKRMEERFAETCHGSKLIGNASCAEAAAFVMTLIQGMAVQAKGGMSRADLYRFIELSLDSWPDDAKFTQDAAA